MGAPKGNKYYLLREKDGSDKLFETPESFLSACNEYFKYCVENPIEAEEIHGTKRGVERVKVEKVRAFTVVGLCHFLGIASSTYYKYSEYKEYKETFTRVSDAIHLQKFENAAVGLLNPNFIGKDIGLVDKKDLSSSDGSMTPQPTVVVQDQKTADNVEKLMNKK